MDNTHTHTLYIGSEINVYFNPLKKINFVSFQYINHYCFEVGDGVY